MAALLKFVAALKGVHDSWPLFPRKTGANAGSGACVAIDTFDVLRQELPLRARSLHLLKDMLRYIEIVVGGPILEFHRENLRSLVVADARHGHRLHFNPLH